MTKILKTVTVWSGSVYKSTPDDVPSEFHDRYILIGKTWMREVSTDVDIDGPLSGAISVLRDAAKDIAEPMVYVSVEHSYDGEYTKVTISGTRPATPEEIVWVNKQIAKDAAIATEREATEIAAFRAKHPDLLK